MALPAPCAHQSSEDRAQSSNACTYGNIRALDFQSFQELWVGLKRQTRQNK